MAEVGLSEILSKDSQLYCIGEMAATKEAVLLHVVNAMHPSKRGLAQSPHIEKYLSCAIIIMIIQGLVFKTEIF